MKKTEILSSLEHTELEERIIKEKKKRGISLVICGIILFLCTYVFRQPQLSIFDVLNFLWGAVVFWGIYNIAESRRLKRYNQSFVIFGWLLFFLSLMVGFVCGTIVDFIMSCVQFPTFILLRGTYFHLLTNIVFPIYVIYSFLTVKSNAIFIGKAYLILKVLHYPLMYCISFSISNILFLVFDVGLALICFLYLTYSKWIQILFSKKWRKGFIIDKGLIAIIALIIIIPYITSIAKNGTKYNELNYEQSFPWDDIMACIDKKVDEKTFISYKPCPKCGAKSDNLYWIYFSSPQWTWEKLCGRAGYLSICPTCRIQVEFICDVMN